MSMLVLISIIGLVSSTIYLVLVCVAARRFRKVSPNPNVDRTDLPLVTVLKPLHGLEPQLERNLESFFQQNYPRFELIFGARSASDPALQIVAALQQKYPEINSSRGPASRRPCLSTADQGGSDAGDAVRQSGVRSGDAGSSAGGFCRLGFGLHLRGYHDASRPVCTGRL